MSNGDKIREAFADRIAQNLRRQRTARSRLEAFERHPLTKVIAGLAFFLTLLATSVALWATFEQLRDLKSEQEARYWQLLTTKASGNSGKVEALEWLFGHGTELVGLDLSCQALGGRDGNGDCKSRPYLRGLTLVKVPGSGTSLHGSISEADVSDCRLVDLDVELEVYGTLMSGCQFTNVRGSLYGSPVAWNRVRWGGGDAFALADFKIEHSFISWEIPGDALFINLFRSRAVFSGITSLRESDFSRSQVSVPFGTQLDAVNLSGSQIFVIFDAEDGDTAKDISWPSDGDPNVEPKPIISTVAGNYFFEGSPPVGNGMPLGRLAAALGGKLFECQGPPGERIFFDDLSGEFITYMVVPLIDSDEVVISQPPVRCSLVDRADMRPSAISEFMR